MASGLYGFTPNVRGIDDALSTPEVKARLAEVAGNIAARANANFALNPCRIPEQFTSDGKSFYYNGDGPQIEPYGSHVDMGAYVPIGKVVCRTALGRYDNSLNNTILKSR
jgi:hypothetical protein